MMLFFTIISCGGGGGGLSRDTTTSPDGVGGTGVLLLEIEVDTTVVTRNAPAQLTATLTQGGEPLKNKSIEFETTLGSLTKVTAITNDDGVATTALNSGNDVGNGVVTATYDSLSLPFEVLLIEVRDLSLSISSSDVPDNSPVTVTATLTNNGAPVVDQVINFTSSKGILSDSVTTNNAGVATVNLSAGDDKGAGSVIATYDNLSENIPFVILGKSLSISTSNIIVSRVEPVTITTQLLNGNQPIANEIITFTSTLGHFSPSQGTVLTNESGIAGIVLSAGDVAGAGTVTATLSDNTFQTINFTSQGDDISVAGDINITLVLVDSDGNPTETISSSKPGRIIATVNGITSAEIVTFSSTLGSLPIATAITNSENQATVDILAGTDLGAGIITASINSGETGNGFIIIGSTNVSMGTGTPFVEGEADVSLSTISAGGTSVVSVDIVDDAGNLFTELVEVNFTSSCTSSGTATLSSPVATSNGRATSTYLAKGCIGDDTVSVSANAGGINLSASAAVTVLPASIGSIEFESASPEQISILGTGALGGSESSTVKFKVLDTNGNPVNNTAVDFSLNTNVGGISINPSRATSNADGIVQTVINSGSVSTSVRVQATILDSSPAISTQSSVLVVSTGIPDQDSFSLSASVLNPEAWGRDGTEVDITARLADAFNNPVPNGTAVSFTTEGGSIESSCVTDNGICTVKWRSQFPKPDGEKLTSAYCLDAQDQDPLINCATSTQVNNGVKLGGFYGQEFSGRATITATAIGEESFPDLNGNNRFDESEYTQFLLTDVSGRPFDLDEAFVDYNEDDLFNPEEAGGELGGEKEVPLDFDSSLDFTKADGKYNGVLCAIPSHQYCDDTVKSVNVRASLVLVMSDSTPYITVNETNDDLGASVIDSTDSAIYIVGKNSGSAVITLADLNNQPIPGGSTVSLATTIGSVSPSSFTFPSTNYNGGHRFGVVVTGTEDGGSGTLSVSIETPSGIKTSVAIASVIVQ